MRKLLLFLALLVASPVFGQTNTARMLSGVNSQTGTTYTFVCTDATKLVTFNNASAVTATLFAANDQCSGPGIMFSVKNIGAGNVTITPASGSIDGAASLILQQNQGADIWNDGVNYFTQGSVSAGPPPAPGFPRLDQVTDQNQSKLFNQGSSTIGFTNGPGMDLSGETSPATIPLIAGCATTSNGQICFDSTGLNFHGYNGTDSILPSFNPSSVTSGDLAGFLLSGGKWTLQDLGPINGTNGTTIIQANITNIVDGDSICWDASTSSWVNCTPGVPPIVSSATSYTFDGTERGEILYFTAVGAKALSLPQASDNNAFDANWFTFIKNDGAGLITITATTSTFFSTGTNTLTIAQGVGCSLFSDTTGNGTYYDKCSMVPLTASTNITLTPAAYAIAVAAAGGGGGTITGSGTANTVTKWTGVSTVGNGCGLDDGTHAVRCDNGYDVNQLGAYLWWATNNNVTGTTANKMACDDGTGKAIICPSASSTTNDPLGVAVAANGATPGTTGSTGICVIGFCSVIFDNAATAGHYAQSSSTVNGDLSDVGATIPTNGQSYWFINTSNSGAGTAGVIRNLKSSELNASSVSGGNGKNLQIKVNGTAITKPIANFVDGTGITLGLSTAGNTTTITPTVTSSSGISGLTTGQVPIAGSATTLTSSKALQGTDTKILSSGTVSGTGATLCTDANGGATTSGCSSGGISSINTSATGPLVTIVGAGSAGVSTSGNTITVSAVTGAPAPSVQYLTGTYTIPNSDNTQRDVFTGTSAITLPQAGAITVSPLVSVNVQGSNAACATTCSSASFSINSSHTQIVSVGIRFGGTATTVSNVTDSAGNTYTKITPDVYDSVGQNTLSLWRANSTIASGSDTLTFTIDGTSFIFWGGIEYNTVSNDHADGAVGANNPSVTLTNSYTNELNVGTVISGLTSGCPTGWTSRISLSLGFFVMCEKIVSSQASTTYSSNAPGGNAAVQASNYQISGVASYTAGWYVTLENAGTGFLTVTPTTSTINGRSTLVLAPNEVCQIMSDGTNYNAICGTIPNLVNNGIPGGATVVYGVDQTGQTSAITDTTMITPAVNSVWRFTGTINCTTTSASATATLNLKYTDTANTAQTVSVTDTCTSLVTTGIPQMVQALRAKASTAITYGVTIANTPTYDVSVRLEKM